MSTNSQDTDVSCLNLFINFVWWFAINSHDQWAEMCSYKQINSVHIKRRHHWSHSTSTKIQIFSSILFCHQVCKRIIRITRHGMLEILRLYTNTSRKVAWFAENYRPIPWNCSLNHATIQEASIYERCVHCARVPVYLTYTGS